MDQGAQSSSDRQVREQSSFLKEVNDAGQVVDFHALRMTFITNLTRSGVAPKTAQMLARHCDINLTMNTYTMLGVMDQAVALEALPAIPAASAVRPQHQRPAATHHGQRGAA
jgi:integrase